MAHKYEKELTEMSDTLQLGIDTAEQIMPGEMAAVKMRVIQSLRNLQGTIHGLLGFGRGGESTERRELPPLSHVMGEPIVYERQPVTSDQLQPSNPEKDAFMAELNEFYKIFPTLTPEQINSKCQLPGGEAVVRALAMKVGIADYKDHEINILLIDKINKAIVELEKYDREMKQAAKSLENHDAKVVDTPPPGMNKKAK